MLINIWRVGVRRTGPDSFQWCPVTGQGAMGTNWGTGSSSWTGGRTSSLWGWRSTGTCCPGRLWSLLLWRYSRLAWTRSCAACCRWPCFIRRAGLDDPQRSLPTPTILWFCDSVILWFCDNYKGGEALAQVAQRSCGCPLPGSVQGKVWWDFEQPGLVEGVPAHGRGIGTKWSLKVPSNSNHSMILWFCCLTFKFFTWALRKWSSMKKTSELYSKTPLDKKFY